MSTVAGFPPLLVEVGSCGVCGQTVGGKEAECRSCSLPLSNTAFPVLDPRTLLATVTLSSPKQRIVCLLLDGIVSLILASGCALLFGFGIKASSGTWSAPWFVIGALAGLIAGLAGTAVLYRRYGRAVGGLFLKLRCVDSVFLLPCLPIAWLVSGQANPTMVDVRHGGDPCMPVLEQWTGLVLQHKTDTHEGETMSAVPARRGVPDDAVVIVFDTGQVHWFSGTCVIGRSPTNPSGGDVLALPDLSRQLSASHLVLSEERAENGSRTVQVKDQGSSSGTWIEHSDGTERIAAHVSVKLLSGDAVSFGGYRFRVEQAQP